MTQHPQDFLLPPNLLKTDDNPRRIGVEIEFSGISASDILEVLEECFNGEVVKHSHFEFELINSDLGTFILELDAKQLKELAQFYEDGRDVKDDNAIEEFSMDLLSLAAEQFVPWEIVTAPLPIDKLYRLYAMLGKLREKGAKGTRHSIRFAFGVHLNMELPNLKVETVLAYMRAYLCLYEWIARQEKIDIVRRVTPYINHFSHEYIAKVINMDYQPTMKQLIDDYLEANPTRNRSLDMLPLFSHIDAERVKNIVKDKRVKARPTLHYRLPNCDIDNPEWGLDSIWREWLQVEWLAADEARLEQVCRAFYQELKRFTRFMDDHWAKQCEAWLVDLNAC